MNIHHNALRLAATMAAAGVVSTHPLPGMAQSFKHGEIRVDQETLAWDASAHQWVTPEAFWLNYAESKGGLTWGRGRDYPPYEDVKEGDLFMVELDAGECLMEFFHGRWRRANDVRRWDPRFNEYGACPDVFA